MIKWLQKFKPNPKSERWEDYFHGREELLWEGRPAKGIKGTPGMVFLSLFGLPFLAAGSFTFLAGFFGIFTGGITGFFGGVFMVLFSLPFIAVGAGLVFGTWFASYYSTYFVRYAVTNKRAYIAKSWWNHSMESYPIKGDSVIELEQGRFDTVYFFTEHTVDSDGDRRKNKIGFDGIDTGMDVYQLLRKVQADAAERERGANLT